MAFKKNSLILGSNFIKYYFKEKEEEKKKKAEKKEEREKEWEEFLEWKKNNPNLL